MHTPNRKIKPFSQVNLGEEVFNHEDEESVGFIKWKGSTFELERSGYNTLLDDEDEDGENRHIPEDYEWVIIEDGMYGDTLYNYNCDPSGVIIMEEQTSPAEDIEEFVNLGKYRKDNRLMEVLRKADLNSELYLVRVSNYIDIEDIIGLRLEYDIVNVTVAVFSNKDDAINFSQKIPLIHEYIENNKVRTVVVVNANGDTLYTRTITLSIQTKEISKVYNI